MMESLKYLFTDPVYWSKSVAGSSWRFGSFLSLHVLFCALIGTILYRHDLSYLIPLLILTSLLYPVLYLYALRRLIALVENKGQSQSNEN
jgi:hypothetical protein